MARRASALRVRFGAGGEDAESFFVVFLAAGLAFSTRRARASRSFAISSSMALSIRSFKAFFLSKREAKILGALPQKNSRCITRNGHCGEMEFIWELPPRMPKTAQSKLEAAADRP
jgi:hypothetical protein